MADDIEGLDPDSPIAYIALSVLSSRQKTLIPEMLYLFSPKQVLDFIKLYSGETLKIPTLEDFDKDLMVAIAAHHLIVQKKSIDWMQLTYEIDKRALDDILRRLDGWLKDMGEADARFLERLQGYETARTNSAELARELIRTDKRDRLRQRYRSQPLHRPARRSGSPDGRSEPPAGD
jgi:hypothetical protein